ncbi:hypothetical protein V6N13_107671 [Hibiscus sabdariffa]|uniref:Uncharacterized protein n=1 Tax=Hibiscus sabdariffa TaxID=183260 RepID=A0ABR2SQV6_9ROSI
MRSCFAVFYPVFKSVSQLREKAEASSIAENRFDRVSNGIVDALKDHEDILEMGGVGKILSLLIFRLRPRWLLIVLLCFQLIHALLSSLPSLELPFCPWLIVKHQALRMSSFAFPNIPRDPPGNSPPSKMLKLYLLCLCNQTIKVTVKLPPRQGFFNEFIGIADSVQRI